MRMSALHCAYVCSALCVCLLCTVRMSALHCAYVCYPLRLCMRCTPVFTHTGCTCVSFVYTPICLLTRSTKFKVWTIWDRIYLDFCELHISSSPAHTPNHLFHEVSIYLPLGVAFLNTCQMCDLELWALKVWAISIYWCDRVRLCGSELVTRFMLHDCYLAVH